MTARDLVLVTGGPLRPNWTVTPGTTPFAAALSLRLTLALTLALSTPLFTLRLRRHAT